MSLIKLMHNTRLYDIANLSRFYFLQKNKIPTDVTCIINIIGSSAYVTYLDVQFFISILGHAWDLFFI
jgi:hypothetical protein